VILMVKKYFFNGSLMLTIWNANLSTSVTVSFFFFKPLIVSNTTRIVGHRIIRVFFF
jgi:hypothetical protein